MKRLVLLVAGGFARAQSPVHVVRQAAPAGAEGDRAYDYLAQGNTQLLETLRRRFVNGPLDWAKEWGIPADGRTTP